MMNIRFTILSAMAFFALGEAQAQKAWIFASASTML